MEARYLSVSSIMISLVGASSGFRAVRCPGRGRGSAWPLLGLLGGSPMCISTWESGLPGQAALPTLFSLGLGQGRREFRGVCFSAALTDGRDARRSRARGVVCPLGLSTSSSTRDRTAHGSALEQLHAILEGLQSSSARPSRPFQRRRSARPESAAIRATLRLLGHQAQPAQPALRSTKQARSLEECSLASLLCIIVSPPRLRCQGPPGCRL